MLAAIAERADVNAAKSAKVPAATADVEMEGREGRT
jgi:hypothetical protein